MPATRRFPPPWTVEETAPCFIVRDHNGQALVFVYCEDEPGRRSTGKLLTRNEARRIAANYCCYAARRQKAGVTRCSRTFRQSAQCPQSPQLRKYRWSGIKLLLDNDRTEA